MFGLFRSKRAPEGPVDFCEDIEIARPAAEVYPLIDWADPRNAKRQLGNDIAPVAGTVDRFEMVLNGLPDHRFEIVVTEAEPGHVYEYASRIVPQIGRLVASKERYTLEPLGPDRCRLALRVSAEFDEGLRMREFQHELCTMGTAVHSALEKFRIHAEHGLGASKAVEGQVII
jgi:hypothetical protein